MATAVDSQKQRAPSSRRDVHALGFLERAFQKELGRVARSIRNAYVGKIRSLKSEIASLRSQLDDHTKPQASIPPVSPKLCTMLPSYWESKARYSPKGTTTLLLPLQSPIQTQFKIVQPAPPIVQPQQLNPTNSAPTTEKVEITTSPTSPTPVSSALNPASSLSPREELERYREHIRKSPLHSPQKQSNAPRFTIKYRNWSQAEKILDCIESFCAKNHLPKPVSIFQQTATKSLVYTLDSPSDLQRYEAKRAVLEALHET